MKVLHKLIAVCMAAVLLLCPLSIGAGAVRAPIRIGDADGDWDVTILDVTRIQRWLTGLNNMTKLQQFAADVNGDGELDILDANRIQRKLAGLSEFYNVNFDGINDYGFFGYYISEYRFYADYDSGKARVGVPVTFHADALSLNSEQYGDPQLPMTYEFYIDNVLIQERSVNNELEYTFDKAGSYDIGVVMYNNLDETAYDRIYDYQVVDGYPLDRPVIVSALFREDTCSVKADAPLTVCADGGSGEYKYMYTVVGMYSGYQDDGFFIEEPADSNSDPVLSTGYIDSNIFDVPDILYWLNGRVTVTVYVRDSKGQVSDPVTVTHWLESIPG